MCPKVVEDILDDDQDMEDMNLGKRAENDQLLAASPVQWLAAALGWLHWLVGHAFVSRWLH